MRFLVATTLVAGIGCGFEHGQLGDDGPSPDARVDPVPSNDAPGLVQRTCKYPDGALRLCLEFDDGVLTPKVHDSSTAQLDPDASGLDATMRGSDPAVTVGAGSNISIIERAELDISAAITIEAWIRPTLYQSSTIISNQGQYLMGVDGTGRVVCSMAGTQVVTYSTSDRAHPYTWHHIACTFNNNNGGTVRAYLDGSSQDCMKANASAIATSGSAGTKIAPNFPGDIDAVRIYSRDLGPDSELCAHAGRTSCQRSCQSSNGELD